jgi:NitT/TauT family transport system substrate-binding protein
MAIILQEALRGLFYAPFYVALARDAFAAEGVEIRFTSSPRPQDAALRLMDGTVDVWGAGRCGSWRPIKSGRTATSSASPRS